MKLKSNRLSSLSQYIDVIRKTSLSYSVRYLNILDWSDFLKQPITEGMFWNKLNKPDRNNFDLQHKVGNDAYFSELKAYEAAEKEVIFKGWEYKKEIRNSGGNYTHILTNGKIEIYVQWGGFYLNGEIEIKTPEDLANATNGELIINFEI